ncbi:unnamed protein product [Acanthocheilonema viteae]|uniref:Uncharacterized protein n=1 Tax=Acanthocheilonema viteae TaxID=6277 RepID=A0A498SI66_ACAVI|nr:unnamed protein product [Acanthocheilonema viteae]
MLGRKAAEKGAQQRQRLPSDGSNDRPTDRSTDPSGIDAEDWVKREWCRRLGADLYRNTTLISADDRLHR